MGIKRVILMLRVAALMASLLMGTAAAAWAASVPTTTTLTVSSGASSLSSVGSGTALTFVAAVSSGTTKVTTGQVNLCDALATYCTDIHLFGTAQLTSSGSASFKFIPGIGSHSYKAVFAGTPNGTTAYAPSSSTPTAVTITGVHQTTTAITQSGITGSYTLTATVSGIVNAPSIAAPVGMVSFLDTTNNNSVLATAELGTGTSGLSFLNSSSPATVDEPNVAAAADFNGDGIPDLAVTASNEGQVTLTILLGNGDGTFRAATSPTVGLYPDSVVVADFNGDGIVDLAVDSVDNNTVTILVGNGDGTFLAKPTLTVVGVPQSMATGDFNGDGVADLAVASGNSVLIFLGNGDGTFTAAATSPATGGSAVSVAIGDLNGDGNADLAVSISVGNTVTILLGKGDGTFTATPVSPVTGGTPFGVSIADFNGDGNLDLAVANVTGDPGSAVTVLLGNGDGTFKASTANPASGLSYKTVAVADFNGDGIPDMAVSGFLSDVLAVFLGKGDGTFATAMSETASAPLNSGYLTVADFNGDGVPDLAQPNQDPSGTVAILLTQPTQTVTATLTGFSISGQGVHQVSASYPGDTLYGSSVSSPIGLTAVLNPTVMVTPSLSSIPTGQALSVTVAVSGGAGNPAPTGYFVLTAGSYTAPLTLLNNGSANLSIPAGSLVLGTNTLTAAYTPDYTSSTIYNRASGSATVVVTPPPLASSPTFSPAAGTYSATQNVTLSDTTAGATIYYTTNGAAPTVSSSVYSGPIPVASTETIQAIAAASGYSQSAVATATYTIIVPDAVPALGSMSPAFTSLGGPAVTLTLAGSGFSSGSTVYWGSSVLSTQFVSATQLTAQIPASDIAAAGVTGVTVQTPSPGGGTSNGLQFEVDSAPAGPTTSPSFSTMTAAIAPGSIATYQVTLPSAATNISAACLNLPSGAACSYSAASGAISITTSPNTPAGTYQITVVFTETEPVTTSALVLLPILLLPFLVARRGLVSKQRCINACLGLVLLAGTSVIGGCGGSSGSIPTTPSNPTHQVTSSGVVSLTVK